MLICCISHHLSMSSIRATKQKHPNCRYAVRVLLKTTCHVHFGINCCLSTTCRPMVVTRNGHYWKITPDLWLSQKESRFFPLAPHSRAFSHGWLWPGLCEEHFCKIWRGAKDYCVKERGFGDGLFRLDGGMPRGRVSQFEMWQDGPCSFSMLIRLADVGRSLNFSPLSLPSPLGSTYIFLSYIFCYLLSGYVLAGLLLLQSTTWIRRSWLSGVIKVPKAVWLYLYVKTQWTWTTFFPTCTCRGMTRRWYMTTILSLDTLSLDWISELWLSSD